MSETDNEKIEDLEGATEENPEELDINSITDDDIINLDDADLSKISNIDETKFNTEDEDAKEDTDEDSDKEDDPDKDEPKKKDLSPEERISDLEKQIKNLEKIKEDRGNFIEKQNATINTLKSKLDGLKSKKEELDNNSTNKAFYDDPEKAIKAAMEKPEVERQLKEAENELAISQRKSQIQNIVPDFHNHVDDIVEYFKAIDPAREVDINGESVMVGTTDEVIQSFKKDPYAIDPNVAIQAYNGAMMLKRSQLNEAKVQSEKGKTKRTMDKVNSAASYTTATSKPGKSSKTSIEDISDEEIQRMSDPELSEYLSQLNKLA